MAGLPESHAINEIFSRYQDVDRTSRDRSLALYRDDEAYHQPYYGHPPLHNEDVETEEYEDSRVSQDHTGTHFSMSRSRTMQTSHVRAKTNVDYKMSVGPHGVSMQKRATVSFSTPTGHLSLTTYQRPRHTGHTNPFLVMLGRENQTRRMPIYSLMYGSENDDFGYETPEESSYDVTYPTEYETGFGTEELDPFSEGPVITELPEDMPKRYYLPYPEHDSSSEQFQHNRTRLNKNADVCRSKHMARNKNLIPGRNTRPGIHEADGTLSDAFLLKHTEEPETEFYKEDVDTLSPQQEITTDANSHSKNLTPDVLEQEVVNSHRKKNKNVNSATKPTQAIILTDNKSYRHSLTSKDFACRETVTNKDKTSDKDNLKPGSDFAEKTATSNLSKALTKPVFQETADVNQLETCEETFGVSQPIQEEAEISLRVKGLAMSANTLSQPMTAEIPVRNDTFLKDLTTLYPDFESKNGSTVQPHTRCKDSVLSLDLNKPAIELNNEDMEINLETDGPTSPKAEESPATKTYRSTNRKEQTKVRETNAPLEKHREAQMKLQHLDDHTINVVRNKNTEHKKVDVIVFESADLDPDPALDVPSCTGKRDEKQHLGSSTAEVDVPLNRLKNLNVSEVTNSTLSEESNLHSLDTDLLNREFATNQRTDIKLRKTKDTEKETISRSVNAQGTAQMNSQSLKPINRGRGKAIPKKNKNATAVPTSYSAVKSTYPADDIAYDDPFDDLSFEDLVQTVGLQVKAVRRDGNSLFSAAVDQLRVRGDFSYTPRSLRLAVVDYLKNNPCQEDGTHLSAFIELEGYNWDQYLNLMRRDGSWTDHIILMGLANLLDRNIAIYEGHYTDGHLNLQRTEIIQNAKRADKMLTACSGTEEAERSSDQNDALYMGHITKDFYSSLRHVNWKDHFIDVLSKRQDSCINSKPKEKPQKTDLNISDREDSNEDVSVRKKVSSENKCKFTANETDFLFNFMRRHPFFMHNPCARHRKMTYSNKDVFVHIFPIHSRLEFDWTDMFLVHPEKHRYWNVRYTYRFPIDTRASNVKTECHPKDLLINNRTCTPGFLKISPVTPDLWKPICSIEKEGEVYVEHFNTASGPVYDGILCDWPTDAEEWKSRSRPSGWPSSKAVEEIVSRGCFVVPADASRCGREDNTLWSYCFGIADNILFSDYIPASLKAFYFLVVELLDFVFYFENVFTFWHWKSLFFYTLERVSFETVKRQPCKCLNMMLDLLETSFKRKFFPCYFVKEKNICIELETLDSEKLTRCLKKIQMLRTCTFELLVHTIDERVTAHRQLFLKVVDELTYLVTEKPYIDSEKSYVDCLVPIATHGILAWIKWEQFDKGLDLINVWLKEWHERYMDSHVGRTRFTQNVLSHLTAQVKWLFAFYLDCKDNSEWLTMIQTKHASVPLKSVLGDDGHWLQKVMSRKLSDISVPETSASAFKTTFVSKLVELLDKDLGSPDAAVCLAQSFLRNKAYLALSSIMMTKNSYTFYRQIGSLYNIFETCYRLFYKRSEVDTFFEFMDVFASTCIYMSKLYAINFALTLSEYFGHSELTESLKAMQRLYASDSYYD